MISRESLDKLFDLVGSDFGFMAELMETFLDESQTLVARMRHALETTDQTKLRQSAHTLKSGARDFGAADVSHLCGALEAACENAWPETAPAHVQEISLAYESARSELSRHLEAAKRGVWVQ